MNPWQLHDPSTYPQGSPAVLGPQETVQLVTQQAREDLSVQREAARRAFLHQQGYLLLVLIKKKRLRSRIWSVIWQEIVIRTILMHTCKFDSSNMKQMRDFPEDKGDCNRDSLRTQIKLLKISETIW